MHSDSSEPLDMGAVKREASSHLERHTELQTHGQGKDTDDDLDL
ncbi:MAG: hypothetical protein AAF197_12350 [Pseudomonadota bacterium]